MTSNEKIQRWICAACIGFMVVLIATATCNSIRGGEWDSRSMFRQRADTGRLDVYFDKVADWSSLWTPIAIVQEDEPTKATPPVAAGPDIVSEPQYEIVYEQVCVNGVCRMQPVRRLIQSTKRLAQAAIAAPARTGVCDCGCANCRCGDAVATMSYSYSAPVYSYSAPTFSYSYSEPVYTYTEVAAARQRWTPVRSFVAWAAHRRSQRWSSRGF